jgi:hypothetical protein
MSTVTSHILDQLDAQIDQLDARTDQLVDRALGLVAEKQVIDAAIKDILAEAKSVERMRSVMSRSRRNAARSLAPAPPKRHKRSAAAARALP